MSRAGPPLTPCALDGRVVRLEPLSAEHAAALARHAFEQDLWQWTSTRIRTELDLRAYLAEALAAQQAGTALPFVTRLQESGHVIGSTRFGNYDAAHRRVEIGWTWIAPPWQRTAVNPEAKLLMLTHAFETLGCIRVELKTDALNLQSQRAIEKLGATREGTLRRHMIVDGGRFRDTVYYSILADEWPRVRSGLEQRLKEEFPSA